MKSLDTKIVCDICKAEYNVSKDTLREERVTLEKDGISIEATITILQCPVCGKTYPVIVDTCKSLTLLEKVRETYYKRAKYLSKNKPIPTRLDEKYKTLNQKLDFQRQQIAEKFNGAIYQLDGDKIQLDYRYHAR